MKRFTKNLAMLLAATCVAGMANGRQDRPEKVRVSLAVDDPRPLAAAIVELERRHGAAITYEDAPIVHVSEMKDVTERVRLDLAEYAPGAAPRVIIPLGGAWTMHYDVSFDTGRPTSLREVVQAAVDAHAASGLAGRYRVIETGVGLSVIPAAHTDADARVSPVRGVLEAEITIAKSSRNGIDALQEICAAVSRASGKAVTIGTAPASLLGRHTTTVSAEREPARDVLARLCKEFNAKVSWQLFHDAGGDFYALNLHVVE